MAGFCLVRAHQKLQPSNQGTEIVSFAWMIDTELWTFLREEQCTWQG